MLSGTGRLIRAGGIPLFAAALVSMAAVDHPKTGWGVNTRLALVFAVVDEGRLAIDSYHARPPTQTFDKAYHRGHFYSDKIFGVSLLALPVYAGLRALGFEPGFRFSNWILRVWAVSLPAALSLVLAWALLVRGGGDPWRSLVAVGLAFWGSMWFGFSTAFFPYATGVAAALLALWWILFPWPGRLVPRVAAAVGALCGFAILCDMVFGLLVIGLVGAFAWRLGADAGLWRPLPGTTSEGQLRPAEVAGALVAGAVAGLLPLALFFGYTLHLFGRLSIPYEFEALPLFRTEMQKGFMGITRPRLGPLWFITLHPHRGLFFWTPLFGLSTLGLLAALRASGLARVYGVLGVWAVASYLAFNSGYYMWWGGWAMGPRLLLPLMAVLPLGLLAFCRPDAPRWAWSAVVALGALGVVLSLPVAFVDPETPVLNPYPLLRDATPGSALRVPQLDTWLGFFRGEPFRSDTLVGSAATWLSFAAAVAAPALGALWARRRLAAVSGAAPTGPD